MNDLNTQFRPSIWDDIHGQNSVVERLRKQVELKKGLSNAYVFSGRSGVGKTTLARLFFKALNCENPTNGNPCNECAPCKNMAFDMMEINASDTRGIDDMRDIIRDIKYSSTGQYRGILLDETHMLSKPAWNCLLKPIEESGQKAIWFLCTTELSKIPKTIQTRCQVYKLNPLTPEDIHKRLVKVVDEMKLPITSEELQLVARNSDNNLRQAIHILEQYSTTNSLENIITKEASFEFLDGVKTKSTLAIWKYMTSWEGKYPDFDSFLNSLKNDITICLKMKAGLYVYEETDKKRLDKYKEYATILDIETLKHSLRTLLEVQEKTSGVWDYGSIMLLSSLKLTEKR